MPAFILPALQAATITLLQARPGLTGVQVTDGYAGDATAEPERIYTQDARSDQLDPAGLKAGRTHYQERGEFDVIIQVLQPDGTPAQVKARCNALAVEVAQCVADNRTLGGVAGLNFAVGAHWDLTVRYGQTGAAAEIAYTIRYEARLT